MAPPERRPVVDAAIAAAATAGFPVGDGQAPAGAVPPYAVVFALDDSDSDGPIDDWEADAVHQIQVTSVGETREQAQGVADEIRKKMTPPNMTVTGRRVLWVQVAVGGGVERDDDTKPPLFYAVDLYEVATTPA